MTRRISCLRPTKEKLIRQALTWAVKLNKARTSMIFFWNLHCFVDTFALLTLLFCWHFCFVDTFTLLTLLLFDAFALLTRLHFWHFCFLTLLLCWHFCSSDTFALLTLLLFDTFAFLTLLLCWHFCFVDTFALLTLLLFDTFAFWHFCFFDTFAFWHFCFSTLLFFWHFCFVDTFLIARLQSGKSSLVVSPNNRTSSDASVNLCFIRLEFSFWRLPSAKVHWKRRRRNFNRFFGNNIGLKVALQFEEMSTLKWTAAIRIWVSLWSTKWLESCSKQCELFLWLEWRSLKVPVFLLWRSFSRPFFDCYI